MTIVGEAFVLVSPDGAGFAKKLQTQLAGAGLGNAGVVAGVAIAAGVVVGLSAIGAEFGKVRNTIIKETGATTAEVAGLFDTVKRAVLDVPVSLGAAATAVDELFKRGVPLGPQLDKLAKQELFLAKITKGDLASTVEQTTAIFAKFNIPLREQSKELDVLFKASQKSGKSFDELVQPLLAGGAALGQFGFSLDKSIALITSLQQAGVNVQPALAGLRKAFSQIAKEGGDPQKTLTNLIAEFKDGTDPTKAMADAIKLFGTRAGTELATAIQKGKFETDALLKVITNGRDGIIATGEATLTLADRFTLIRNRAEDAFSGLGVAVRSALVGVVVAGSEPIGKLAEAIAHLVAQAAPLGIVFAPVALALRGILPSISAFAAGVDGIASGLGALPGPAGAVALGLAAVALAALGAADGLIAAAIAAGAFTVSLLSNPLFLAATAVAALGAALLLLRPSADPAIKVAKDFTASLIDSESATTIFRGGIDNITDGLKQLFDAQVRAGKSDLLTAVFAIGATDADRLATAITGTAASFGAYVDGVRAAAKAAGASKDQIFVLTVGLDAQRNAFVLLAQQQVAAAVGTGLLTVKQKDALVAAHRLKDGTTDYAGVLNSLNVAIASQVDKQNTALLGTQAVKDAQADLAQQLADGVISEKDAEAALTGLGLAGNEVALQLEKLKLQATDIAATQDALALSTVKTSAGYGELARSLATGQTSVAGATLTLEKLGLSAAGAAAEAGNLNSAIQSFIDGAVGQLPDVGTAISEFGQTLKADQDQLATDREKNVELHKKINEALAKSTVDTRQKLAAIDLQIQQDQAAALTGSDTTDKLQRDLLKRSQIIGKSGQASQDLAKQVAESNAAILASTKKLADDGNVNKFTNNMIANLLKVAAFTANLQTLVDHGFNDLAGALAKQGPEAAAQLAANLAASPAKAAIAEKTAELAKATTENYRKFLEKNAPELIGVGATQGLAIGKAIADGITAELVHNFPFLRQIGVTSGEEIIGGAKEGAGSSTLTDPIIAEARKHIADFRTLGSDLGVTTGGGVRAGLGSIDPTSKLAGVLRAHREDLRTAGESLGTAAGEGIATGIRAQFDNVGNAVLAVTQHGVAVARGAWVVQSPSKVFAEIGAQAGAGLAQGLSGSAVDVGAAVAALASGVTTRVQSSLAGLGGIARTIRFDVPTGDARAAGERLGAALVDGVSGSANDVAEAGRLVGSHVSAGIEEAASTVRPTITSFSRAVTDDLRAALRFDQVPVALPSAATAVAGLGASIRQAVPDVRGAVEAVEGAAKLSFSKLTFAPEVVPAVDLVPVTHALTTLRIDPPTVAPTINLAKAREALAAFRPEVRPIFPRITPRVDPVVMPHIDPVTIIARFGQVDPPILPPVVPTLEAAEFLANAGRVYARLTEGGRTAGQQAAQNVAGGLNAGIVGATGDVRGALARVIVFPDQGSAAQAAGARVVEAVAAGVAGSAGNVAAALGANVRAGVASLGPAVREGLASSAASLSGAGRLLASAVDLAPLSASGAAAGEAAAQGVTEGLKAVPVAVGRLRSELVGGLASTAASVQHAAQAIVPQVDSARFAASGAGAGAALGRGLVSGVESTSVPVAAAFQKVAAPALPDLSGVGLELGRSLGDEARIAVTSSSGAFSDAGTTLAAGLSSRVSAGLAAIDPGPHVADKVVGRLQEAFDHLTDAKSTAGFVTFADGLVNTFQQTFDQVAVDAEQLQNVLDALTDKRSASADKLSTSLLAKLQEQKLLITKFAPIEAPSAVLIAQAAQSIQVPRPEDRADAQQPRDAAPRFSIQQTFNEKIDPLHVAAELAWQLL